MMIVDIETKSQEEMNKGQREDFVYIYCTLNIQLYELG